MHVKYHNIKYLSHASSLKLIFPDIKEQICGKGVESKSITLELSHQNLTSVLIISFYPPLLVI